MTDNQKSILKYLENSYSGAKMMDDVETQERIARAIIAFEADPEMEIFSKEFIEKEVMK